MKRLLLLLLLGLSRLGAAGAEPYLREGDVISFVGGEDMVVAAEMGEIELLLTRGNPALHLRFRSLAREGDTVLEQHRELNYPPLQEQLATAGTAVVVAEFGSMEKLAGMNESDFARAYATLLERISEHGSRRGVLIANAYSDTVKKIGQERNWPVIEVPRRAEGKPIEDGAHLSAESQKALAVAMADRLGAPGLQSSTARLELAHAGEWGQRLNATRRLIQEKNLLWFYYYRPQNWAFLAGDRTNQPSSRDYRDPTKRWFPAEMEQFLPLIAEKEKEIDAAVAGAR